MILCIFLLKNESNLTPTLIAISLLSLSRKVGIRLLSLSRKVGIRLLSLLRRVAERSLLLFS
jgi:hypothetical protein